MNPHLSVIIPAYNEEKRLPGTLRAIVSFLRQQSYVSEILVSDDGSTDRTAELALEQLRDFPHRVLRAQRNRGKGHAVRQGMMAADGGYLFFSDADLSTPIEELSRFLAHLEKDQDLVIGSRALPDSRVEVHQNRVRKTMGQVYNRIARRVAFQGIRDSQCGFKGFRRDVARHLFSRQKINGFSFDAEIIYLAQKEKYRLLELPVTWRNSPYSSVRFVTHHVSMLWDVLRIRQLHG